MIAYGVIHCVVFENGAVKYLAIILKQDCPTELSLFLELFFRMFCESRGQLQYRIPTKDELKEQYTVRGSFCVKCLSFSTGLVLEEYVASKHCFGE